MMSLRDRFLLFIKGVIIGISNIIPGVSGGTLAVSLGIYEILLDAIGNFFKDIKKKILILFPIVLGVLIGILTGSNLVSYALSHFKVQTIFLFVGLIIGGITILTSKVKKNYSVSNILIFFVTFILVVLLNFIGSGNNKVMFEQLKVFDYFKLFLAGALASGSMIIPGISGSFMLMLFGYYEGIIDVIKNIFDVSLLGHNLLILLPFVMGILLGIVSVAKLISYLLKKYEIKTYFAIIGFVLSSIVVLFMQIDSFKFSILNILTCIITFLWGFFLARNLEKE